MFRINNSYHSPGAVGFGCYSSGGRGGDVYHVTNLKDNGPGSLRFGLDSADGPRTIVFDLSGNIMLISPLVIKKPNITVAGQTAPGEGITVSGYPTDIRSEDIIIRYLRFRCGDYNMQPIRDLPPRGNGNLRGSAAGALDIQLSKNVIIDHVSTSWSIDETLSVTQSNYVTVQHCMITESLNDSYHHKGHHGFGSLIRGNGNNGYTFYRNLFAHHDGRNPGPGSHQINIQIKLELDFVNNVIYGWGTHAGEAVEGGIAELNYVGNYAIANPDSKNANALWDEHKSRGVMVFQRGNYLDGNLDGSLNGKIGSWELFPNFEDFQKKSAPFEFPIVPIASAEEAFEIVMAGVGASLHRDSIDNRVIQQVVGQTGRIIDSQEQVGGLCMLNTLPAPKDTDQDGMPDLWEDAHNLDKSDPDDRNNYKLSKDYTNLEVYLNHLVSD